MMFKKFRKYLIVLMAVLMVASLAVIPVSAADMYGDNSTINYLYDTQEYRLDAWGWAYSATTDFHAEIEVYIGATEYDSDFDHGHAGDPMALVSASGDACATEAQAAQYYYISDCGPGYY